ncbi:MAG: metallophosphatase [Bacteroidota bacterium]
MKRRSFLKSGLGGSLLLTAGAFPMEAFAYYDLEKLTILHTNDVHSRIEPFPMDGGRNQGLGGAARRAALIRKIRKEEQQVLLLDSGDIFQGTPYFNFFGGELEFKLMSEMKYDAATIGNHDFDAGIEGLHRQLPHANFPFVISNYDFSDTLMNGKTKAYQVFQKGMIKVGVFGLGIKLKGLVPENLYKNTLYLNPIKKANEMARYLRNEEKCHYVICLSHLGYQYQKDIVSDQVIARESRDIDLILGGHTHTFLDAPTSAKNKNGKEVLISQAGWAGIVLGRLDVYFEKSGKKRCVTCQNSLIADR